MKKLLIVFVITSTLVGVGSITLTPSLAQAQENQQQEAPSCETLEDNANFLDWAWAILFGGVKAC